MEGVRSELGLESILNFDKAAPEQSTGVWHKTTDGWGKKSSRCVEKSGSRPDALVQSSFRRG